ncbi:MAG: transporter substrate-binding domain-containing protein [Gammaproteobacteria bacterium]|nr:transporter substrate-binding domain-containing protein [Gammaproteobacteria bacterium]
MALSADKLQPEQEILRVGVWEIGPFVVKDYDDSWTGLAIEIWEHVANKSGLKYEYVPYVHHDLLDAIVTGEVDVGIAGIPVTHSYAGLVDFSRTFLHSDLGIASRTDTGTAFNHIISTLSSSTSLGILGAMLLLVLLAAIAFWALEQRVNDLVYDSAHSKFNFFNGIIWALLLITAQEPDVFKNKSRIGRVIGMLLLVIGVTISASYIALITSAITVNQMTDTVYRVEDLPFVKVGSLHDSRASEYLAEHHLKHIEFEDIHDAMHAVEVGQIDAFVANEIVLRFFARRHSDQKISISSVNLETEYYSLAFPNRSTLSDQINPALLEFIESPLWKELLGRYVGSSAILGKHER